MNRLRDRNVPLAVPGMGRTQPPSAPQERGVDSSLGHFPAVRHPHTCQRKALIGAPPFTQGLHATGPSICCEPGAWQELGRPCSLGAHALAWKTGSRGQQGKDGHVWSQKEASVSRPRWPGMGGSRSPTLKTSAVASTVSKF
jgi:hypothetical protein